MPLRRKSRVIRRLEDKYGKPITQIVVDAFNTHGHLEPAARALGVNPKTFWGWIARYRINTRKVAEIEETRVAGG